MKVYEVTGTVRVDLTPEECAILSRACKFACSEWAPVECIHDHNVAYALEGGFAALTVASETRARMLENEADDLQATLEGLGLDVDTRIGPKARQHANHE